jgi:excisionase family DNA binding protein
MGTNSEYVRISDAADLLGVTRFRVSKLVRDGVLAAYTSPLDRRSRLVRRADVEALRNRVEPVVIPPGKALPVAAA